MRGALRRRIVLGAAGVALMWLAHGLALGFWLWGGGSASAENTFTAGPRPDGPAWYAHRDDWVTAREFNRLADDLRCQGKVGLKVTGDLVTWADYHALVWCAEREWRRPGGRLPVEALVELGRLRQMLGPRPTGD